MSIGSDALDCPAFDAKCTLVHEQQNKGQDEVAEPSATSRISLFGRTAKLISRDPVLANDDEDVFVEFVEQASFDRTPIP